MLKTLLNIACMFVVIRLAWRKLRSAGVQLRVRGTLQTLDSGRWTVDMQQLFCPSSYSPSARDKLGHFALYYLGHLGLSVDCVDV